MANPVVKLRAVRRDGRGYIVWCLTDDCEFAEHAFLKTDAQTIQRGHTRDHRNGRTGGGR